jgi:wyosine [tRNA(Phe)-imidazoG37] synthetase (radical SAM superfamily)
MKNDELCVLHNAMSTFLFHDVIFGPVRSRRLGLSLGINLLPNDSKYCSFNCIYCECGWTKRNPGALQLPARSEVKEFLEKRLKEMVEEDYLPDALTYAGNGEPTMHPDFAGIVEDTIALRDQYVRNAKVTVLSNASKLDDPEVFSALLKLDNNIQKLDAGFEQYFNLINQPVEPVRFEGVIENLKKFNGKVIIQSMFLKGFHKNEKFDNTTPEQVDEWLKHIDFIRPSSVMLYSIERATPLHDLEKIPTFDLQRIATKVEALGIEAKVY